MLFRKQVLIRKKTDLFLLGFCQLADLVNLHKFARYILWFSGIPCNAFGGKRPRESTLLFSLLGTLPSGGSGLSGKGQRLFSPHIHLFPEQVACTSWLCLFCPLPVFPYLFPSLDFSVPVTSRLLPQPSPGCSNQW